MTSAGSAGHGRILDLTRMSLGAKIEAQAQQVARLRATLQSAESHLDDLMRLRAATAVKDDHHDRSRA